MPPVTALERHAIASDARHIACISAGSMQHPWSTPITSVLMPEASRSIALSPENARHRVERRLCRIAHGRAPTVELQLCECRASAALRARAQVTPHAANPRRVIVRSQYGIYRIEPDRMARLNVHIVKSTIRSPPSTLHGSFGVSRSTSDCGLPCRAHSCSCTCMGTRRRRLPFHRTSSWPAYRSWRSSSRASCFTAPMPATASIYRSPRHWRPARWRCSPSTTWWF